MLSTKNYQRAFEFVKVITQNFVSFFILDKVKRNFG